MPPFPKSIFQEIATMLTLEEFCATRKRVNDLAPYFGIADESTPLAGYVYAEDCYLVILGGCRTERYYLRIADKEWTTGDLAALERRLYSGWYMFGHAAEQPGEGI
jgi:hypothetical protein